MIEIKITDELLTRAKETCQHGVLKGSVNKGKFNIIGYLGEALFELHYKNAKRMNNFDYDFLLDGKRIEIKSTKTPCAPGPNFRSDVYAFNTRQACDYYFFVHIKNDMSIGWLTGYLSKQEFIRTATVRKAGTVETYKDGSSKTLKGDSYSVLVKDLKKPRLANP